MQSPVYDNLIKRLNRFPQGAPSSTALYRLLRVLFTEREAELVSLLPIKPFDVQQASRIWKMNVVSAQKELDCLASRALILDIESPQGKTVYALPPPMPGFFEFSMMRLRDDVNQKLLAELFHQYLTVETDFFNDLFRDGPTQVGRIFVNETVLRAAYVLDYERASEVIRNATHRAVGMCYCRHKMSYLDKACDAPMDICMTFNGAAQSLIKHHYARSVDVCEGLDLLQQAYAHHLVQFGENTQQGVSFICNCCGCCCEAMIAARRFGFMRPIHTSNFLPQVNITICKGCGRCVSVCPVEGMTLVSANDSQHSERKIAKVDEDCCLGCGVCARVCPQQGITLVPRPQRVITPVNSIHRIVLMAVERGQLQHLIFDNHVLWSQRTLATFLGALLKLPPLKRLLASQQVRSRYLEALARRFS
ncbi:MAG: 4Fe-4S dicluster domain-containing protein [Anaerolineae bacterium]|nr:4Fe-4S dicluster domain-containing protein [Anaerolineae bacterium]